MRGHEALIEMRGHGFVPNTVFIDIDHDAMQSWRDWPAQNSQNAHVLIEPADKRFDFRCFRGLRCYVSGGTDKDRVHAVRDALIDAGAARVIASTFERIGRDEFVSFRVVETTDTDDQFTYPLEVAHHG